MATGDKQQLDKSLTGHPIKQPKRYRFVYMRRCPRCQEKFLLWQTAQKHFYLCGVEVIDEQWRYAESEVIEESPDQGKIHDVKAQ